MTKVANLYAIKRIVGDDMMHSCVIQLEDDAKFYVIDKLVTTPVHELDFTERMLGDDTLEEALQRLEEHVETTRKIALEQEEMFLMQYVQDDDDFDYSLEDEIISSPVVH